MNNNKPLLALLLGSSLKRKKLVCVSFCFYLSHESYPKIYLIAAPGPKGILKTIKTSNNIIQKIRKNTE